MQKNTIREILFQIFMKYKKRYKNPPKSHQMACMWSVTNPPDFIDDTPPIQDIEKAFRISISDDDCLELYNMELEEAVEKIASLMAKQGEGQEGL